MQGRQVFGKVRTVMGADWEGPIRVDLDAALRTMIQEIGSTGARPGADAEELDIELRFSFVDDGSGEMRPVVYLGSAPADTDTHVVRVTLRPRSHPKRSALGPKSPTASLPAQSEGMAAGGGTRLLGGPSKPRRSRRRLKRRVRPDAVQGDSVEPEASGIPPSPADRSPRKGRTSELPVGQPVGDSHEPGSAPEASGPKRHPRLVGGLSWELHETSKEPWEASPSLSPLRSSFPAFRDPESSELSTFEGEDSFPADDTIDTTELLDDDEDTETS